MSISTLYKDYTDLTPIELSLKCQRVKCIEAKERLEKNREELKKKCEETERARKRVEEYKIVMSIFFTLFLVFLIIAIESPWPINLLFYLGAAMLLAGLIVATYQMIEKMKIYNKIHGEEIEGHRRFNIDIANVRSNCIAPCWPDFRHPCNEYRHNIKTNSGRIKKSF